MKLVTSHDPDNHQFMTNMRAAKVAKVADFIPPTEVYGDDSGETLLLGWGSTFGAIRRRLIVAELMALTFLMCI